VSPFFLEFHNLRIKDAFNTIECLVRTSPLNIAMVGTLSHGEFFISDPLRNEITFKHHLGPLQAAECMGTYAMACIVQAGYAYYNTKLVNELPPLSKHAGRKPKKEVSSASGHEGNDDEDIEPSKPCENEIDSLIRNLPSFAAQGRLPKIEDIQPFLKKTFTSLDREDHYFLQSILQDIYVLQHWTRPMDNEEEKTLRSLHNQEHIKTVPSTLDNDEEFLFGTLGVDTLQFEGLKMVKGKHPVNTIGRKRNAKQQSDDESEIDSDDMDTDIKTPASSENRSGLNDRSSSSKKQSSNSENATQSKSRHSQGNHLQNNHESGMYLCYHASIFQI